MRPKYETFQDRAHQKRIVKEVCKSLKLGVLETNPHACIDAIAFDIFGLHSVIEVKRRSNALDRYPTYSISASKIERLISVAEALRLRPVLAVEFADGLYVLEVPKDCDKQEVGGRRDRGDPHDVEMLNHYTTRRFTMIKIRASHDDASTSY